MVVAILDVIFTAMFLIFFVLGSSLMIAYEIIGRPQNATRILDIATDEVLGQVQEDGSAYSSGRARKDSAEDLTVWLIVMFLSILDFIISCIFVDGVKTKDLCKCLTWFNMRMVIVVIFKILVMINLVYGTSWVKGGFDVLMTMYKVAGLYIGYCFLQEIKSESPYWNNDPTEEHVDSNSMKLKEMERGSFSIPTIMTTSPADELSPKDQIFTDPSNNCSYTSPIYDNDDNCDKKLNEDANTLNVKIQ